MIEPSPTAPRNGTPRSERPTAVVTGASAGVGRAVAFAFAKAGYNVAILARGENRLASAQNEIEAQGVECLACPCDVADAEAVEQAAQAAMGRWGRIDIWINNAMATIVSPIRDTPADEFRRVTDVTYLGQVHGTLSALRHMGDRGTIVQVGSALSYRSIPLQSAYCAAKFAVRGFTDSLRSELLHHGSKVRLTMVQLPAVDTPQFDWARSRMPRRLQPVPPIFAPEAVAQHILEAARSAPREMWIGWPAIRIILGSLVVPGLLDRLVSKGAWDGQMTDEPRLAEREDNLFDAPAGDPGASGRFGERSRSKVWAFAERTVRMIGGGLVLLLVLAIVLAVALLA